MSYATQADPTPLPGAPARQLRTSWHDQPPGPAIHLEDVDGRWHTKPLTPAETYQLVRRLVGYLGALHATDPSVPAIPDRQEVTAR